MMYITFGPSSDDQILINYIEHKFSYSYNFHVQILSWISLILIYVSNGCLIDFILRQRKVKSALDWMILMDAILCIFNSIGIIRIGIFGSGSTHHDNILLCVCFNFSVYFINISNRLLTIGIVLYRYVFVLKHTIVEGQAQRQIFVQTLFSVIFLISIVLAGYAVYYKDLYKYHLNKFLI